MMVAKTKAQTCKNHRQDPAKCTEHKRGETIACQGPSKGKQKRRMIYVISESQNLRLKSQTTSTTLA
jgi:hypothetical protein